MKTKTTAKFLILAGLTATLAACSGGGSGTAAPAASEQPANVSAPTPVAPDPVATVVTTAVAATYLAGSEEANAFTLLNAERSRCGFGLLAQSAPLDQAATAHANYLTANDLNYGHFEAAGLPFFTGTQEADRAKAAGYTSPVGADLATNSGPAGAVGQLRTTKQMRGLLGAPYHLLSLLDSYADVGIGYSQAQTPVGTATLEKNALNITMGRRAKMNDLAADQVATYPCAGSTGVNSGLADETPSSIPVNLPQDYKLFGAPIAVKVRTGKVLNLKSATITPSAGGPAIQAQIVSQANDPQKGALTRADSAYILPLAPLQAGGSYMVTVSGTNDGAVFTKSFSFSTGQ